MDPAILADFKEPLDRWTSAQLASFLKKVSLPDLIDLFSTSFLPPPLNSFPP